MRSVDDNIQALTRAVLNDAQTEAEQIMTDARARAEAIRQRAQEQAAAERKEILARATRDAERIRSQAIATTQLKARTMQLEHREKLLESTFEAVRRQLPSVQEREDYPEIARQLLREALLQLGADTAQVRMDERTRTILTDQVVAEIAQAASVQAKFSAVLAQGIGVIAETTDGHRQYNNTLNARLNRLQGVLRAPVYHLLMGEPS